MTAAMDSVDSSSLSLHFIIIFFSLSFLPFTSLSSSNLASAPLQAFKSAVDPAGRALSSWDHAADPCSGLWLGVSCRDGHVTRLVLEGLHLDGPLGALTSLPRLAVLSLKNNSFSSPLYRLDLSLWRAHLKILYLSNNRFFGPFPAGFLLLRRLRRLDLAGNRFSGGIPGEIGHRLPRLLTLRLERNLLTGGIPISLAAATGLADLNFSYNSLTGEIPVALAGFPASSFAGNSNLCGRPLTGGCPNRTATIDQVVPSSASTSRKRNYTVTVIVISTLAIAVLIAFAALLLFKKRRENRGERREGIDDGKRERGERLVFFEGCEGFLMDDLMRGSAEMLGRGAVGTTYRVVMEGEEGAGVVVKRVRREKMSDRRERGGAVGGGGGAEERLLRKIGGWRHPNVVSLRAYYSSEDDLLLVYDYLPNGNLHSLLHGNRGPGRIPVDWTTRLRLAMGAAKGLTFLHVATKSKLAHQNLTSSNILIDEQNNACISDFALHKLLSPSSPSFNSDTEMPGALHTGSTRKITHKCDVYSFGVILLEILTGRTAGDGGMLLPSWVQTVVREEWTSEVFDIELLGYKETGDEMLALLQVALLCLAPDPKNRPKMSVVYKMIEDIMERGSRRGRGSHSPSSLNDHSFESSSPCLSEDTPNFISN